MQSTSTRRIENARPFAFSFSLSSTALIVIDMQCDFINPGGFGASLGNDVSPLQSIIPSVQQLLAVAREVGMTVIHTRECHQPDLSDCPPAKRNRGNPMLRIGDEGPMGRILVADSDGAQIIPELAPLDSEAVIDKPGKGAFYATPLQDHLKALGIQQLIFSGVTTEVCVQTSMREANDRGYDCLLAEDATESYFPEFKVSTLDMIRAQGAIVGWTASVAAIKTALRKR